MFCSIVRIRICLFIRQNIFLDIHGFFSCRLGRECELPSSWNRFWYIWRVCVHMRNFLLQSFPIILSLFKSLAFPAYQPNKLRSVGKQPTGLPTSGAEPCTGLHIHQIKRGLCPYTALMPCIQDLIWSYSTILIRTRSTGFLGDILLVPVRLGCFEQCREYDRHNDVHILCHQADHIFIVPVIKRTFCNLCIYSAKFGYWTLMNPYRSTEHKPGNGN